MYPFLVPCTHHVPKNVPFLALTQPQKREMYPLYPFFRTRYDMKNKKSLSGEKNVFDGYNGYNERDKGLAMGTCNGYK